MLKDILHPSVLFLTVTGLLCMTSCEPEQEETEKNALPVLSITTPDNEAVTSKEDWMKGASISLSSQSDKTIEFNALSASIRGRGNSTWTLPKKPYALK